MSKEGTEEILASLREIRDILRVGMYAQVRKALEEALPDQKSRAAYQMFDGVTPFEKIRVECKLSPNAVVALAARCLSLGLMTINADNRKIRLFDLHAYGLYSTKKVADSERSR